MARGKADISNIAIRVFLQDVGAYYDESRGLTPYRGSRSQKQELLNFFADECCYCGSHIAIDKFSQDHMIAMNKKALGLHAWGNVVPCCGDCNATKHNKLWEHYLADSCGHDLVVTQQRKEKLLAFVKHYRYEPNLRLKEIAENLYNDVGEVALTLIRLRYKQAESVIRSMDSMQPSDQHSSQQGT